MSAFAARTKAAWARLIRKVYEADPLECPQCQGPMRVIALIAEPAAVRRIAISRAKGQHAPARLRVRHTTTATDRAREKSAID